MSYYSNGLVCEKFTLVRSFTPVKLIYLSCLYMIGVVFCLEAKIIWWAHEIHVFYISLEFSLLSDFHPSSYQNKLNLRREVIAGTVISTSHGNYSPTGEFRLYNSSIEWYEFLKIYLEIFTWNHTKDTHYLSKTIMSYMNENFKLKPQ